MTQMMKAIEPKSDQINADDLIAGDMVVTVKEVQFVTGDQPVQIVLAETDKFYRPAKSMSRVLVTVWGDPERVDYAGRQIRLYRDPEVKWGGMKVGGIRISEVSHLTEAMTFPLTEKRGLKKMVTIRPLSTAKVSPKIEAGRAAARAAALLGTKAFTAWWNSDEGKAYRETGDDIKAELRATCKKVDDENGPSALEQRLRAKQAPEPNDGQEEAGAERTEEPPASDIEDFK